MADHLNTHLVSMKIKASDRESKKSLVVPDDEEEFPFGLHIHLDDDVLKKLGMNKEGSFKKGQKMMLKAIVNVDSVTTSDRMGQEPEMDVSLQITEMAIHSEEKSDGDLMFDGS